MRVDALLRKVNVQAAGCIGAIGFLAWVYTYGTWPFTFASPASLGVIPFEGKWVPNEKTTVEDLLTFYGPQHDAACRVDPRRLASFTESQRTALEVERALKVGSYHWMPAHGRFDEWDPVSFIERLIMSRIGLLVVGDSLSLQMTDACKSLLMAPVPAHYNLTIPEGTSVYYDAWETLDEPMHYVAGVGYNLSKPIGGNMLNPQHPITTYLKAKHPEIPAERWTRPFVWVVPNQFGLTAADMDALVIEAGLQGEADANLVNLAENSHRGDWAKLLRHAERSWKSWPGMLKDVIVLSTGAHWPGNFGVALLRDPAASISLYSKMVGYVLDTFAEHHRTAIGMVKSSFRGHPQCSRYDTPWDLPPDFSDRDMFPDYGWYATTMYDDEWLSQIAERSEPGRGRFLDMRLMEGLRADAHGEPDGDCLHWCQPYLPSWWVRAIWHVMDWSPYETT